MTNGERLFDVDGVENQPVVQMQINRQVELRHPILRQPGDAIVGLIRAQRCLSFANSWRNFRVSACGLTFYDEDHTVSIIHGVNNKPKETSVNDSHAEGAVLTDAVGLARAPLSILALVADVQPDQTTKLISPTLLPCYRRCLPALEASDQMVPSTLILSSNTNLSCVQYYDVPTLRRAYEEGEPGILTTINFDTPDGRDRAEWQSKLQRPLANRAHDLIIAHMKGMTRESAI